MTNFAEPATANCFSFWHAPELTPLAAVCLRSFVEMGHAVTLYAYEPVRNAPDGVALADAGPVLPRTFMQRHIETGSIAPFSDRLRYELLRHGAGVWIDCDLLCLRPIATQRYLFGWDNDDLINNAILQIPADAPLLDDMRSIFTTPWVQPWFPTFRRFRYKLKYLLLPGFGYRYMRAGTTGPVALTYYIRRHGLDIHAMPRKVFYPISLAEADVLVAPDGNIARYVSDETSCIHLWNSKLAALIDRAPPPRTSFIARVLDGRWREAIRS